VPRETRTGEGVVPIDVCSHGSSPELLNKPRSSLVALGPGVYSASNRNEYQKQKNNVSGE
jgi:hypothetical protein